MDPDRVKESRRLLEDAGYTYDRDLRVWINRTAGRAIDSDSVAREGPEWVAQWLKIKPFALEAPGRPSPITG